MLTDSYIKYLLCDVDSLYSYFNRKRLVDMGDLKRNLMLLERKNNITIPDHYYRIGLEHSFSDIDTLSEVFVKGLVRLADKYLEYHGDGLFVKAELQNEWQLFSTYMPPIILVAAKIWDTYTPSSLSPVEYLDQCVSKVVKYTTMLPAYVPELRNFKGRQGGLSDLHIHLNGSVESDVVWQDILQHPSDFCSNLAEAQEINKVKELYVQITKFYEPKDFRTLTFSAISIRNKLVEFVFGFNHENSKSFDDYLSHLTDDTYEQCDDRLSLILGNAYTDIQKECYLYIIVLDYLALHKENDVVSGLFHYYLLIFGLCNMMLVQQPSMYGFEEFQKYTISGFRSFSEATYNRRFLQLAGNSLDNIGFIEGRFSPKVTLDKNMDLIENIERGFNTFVEKSYGVSRPGLSLVAHFIKMPDNSNDEFVRFSDLRNELRMKTNALLQLRNENNKYSSMVAGIDAAASELDTPPEVFAESYRNLRDGGYEHFTYHAGEDYYHILSGLRSIFEAITFLDLRCGDRIGHAVASGISVGLWKNNVGERILLKKGEYLDDLVFAYYLISSIDKSRSLLSCLPELALRIEEYAYEIYCDYSPVSKQIEAWLLRYENPAKILEKTSAEWNSVEELFVKYNFAQYRKNYDKIIEVDTYDIFDEEKLTKLQWIVLEYMHDKDIVIETLPTSNIVIGHHHDFSTYHLFNWWKWGKEGHPIPPIVVGTDDAGIFSTNIYNEYCNIFCFLKYQKHMNTDEIMTFIQRIDDNSRIYAFTDLYDVASCHVNAAFENYYSFESPDGNKRNKYDGDFRKSLT